MVGEKLRLAAGPPLARVVSDSCAETLLHPSPQYGVKRRSLRGSARYPHAPSFDHDAAFGEPPNGHWIDAVLLPKDPFRETLFVIILKYGNRRLRDDGTVVDPLVHQMDRGS